MDHPFFNIHCRFILYTPLVYVALIMLKVEKKWKKNQRDADTFTNPSYRFPHICIILTDFAGASHAAFPPIAVLANQARRVGPKDRASLGPRAID